MKELGQLSSSVYTRLRTLLDPKQKQENKNRSLVVLELIKIRGSVCSRIVRTAAQKTAYNRDCILVEYKDIRRRHARIYVYLRQFYA